MDSLIDQRESVPHANNTVISSFSFVCQNLQTKIIIIINGTITMKATRTRTPKAMKTQTQKLTRTQTIK